MLLGYLKIRNELTMFVSIINNYKNSKKMKITKITMAAALMLAVAFTSCKPKDADIAKGVEAALKAEPKAATTKVEVKDGVVTLSGECADADCKANCEKLAAAVKGVKPPVVNNCTVAPPPPPPPASMTTTLDAATQQKVKDGLKDMTTLTLQGFSGKGAIINGEISKEGKMKLMQMLASAKVMLDAASKITMK
jgi:hyperosmotically inducible periplasmic protein